MTPADKTQSQWCVRYGTVSFLVTAPDRIEAERMVRHDDLGARPRRWFEQKPLVRRGPLTVKLATPRDLNDFATRGKIDT